jgi:hypothetical protein
LRRGELIIPVSRGAGLTELRAAGPAIRVDGERDLFDSFHILDGLMATVASHLGKRFGFTCQTWLAIHIANRHFGKFHRVWFSTALNPPRNGSSSNPLLVYQELERIVEINDYNHSRVEQLRRRLCDWVQASPVLSSGIRVRLVAEVTIAPVTAFRPALWRIDLRKIGVSRLVHLGQFPDEYLIRNITRREFKVFNP